MLPKVGRTYCGIRNTNEPIFIITNISISDVYYQIDTKTVVGYPNIVHIQLGKKHIKETWDKWYKHVPESIILAKMI